MKYLVTGANGHLGNNVVRELLKNGEEVRASVRNTNNTRPFKGLECEVVYADILDRTSLVKAFSGIDILYHVAAVFKHWARNPEKEIVEANVEGTRNVLEAAAECGIKKIIYVSSIAALDAKLPVKDETCWGTTFPNPYFKSKNEAELLAWEIAEKLDLQMISVLPAAMIGPRVFDHMTPSMNLLNNIVHNRLPFDPQYGFHFVHVRDVAGGMLSAEKGGHWGERFILGTRKPMTTTEIFSIGSAVTGEEPALLPGNIRHYYKDSTELNIDKAKKLLGYDPMSAEDALRETLEYIKRLDR